MYIYVYIYIGYIYIYICATFAGSAPPPTPPSWYGPPCPLQNRSISTDLAQSISISYQSISIAAHQPACPPPTRPAACLSTRLPTRTPARVMMVMVIMMMMMMMVIIIIMMMVMLRGPFQDHRGGREEEAHWGQTMLENTTREAHTTTGGAV